MGKSFHHLDHPAWAIKLQLQRRPDHRIRIPTTLMQNLTSATIDAQQSSTRKGFKRHSGTTSFGTLGSAPVIDGGLTKSGIARSVGRRKQLYRPTVINAGTLSLNPAIGGGSGSHSAHRFPIAFDNVSAVRHQWRQRGRCNERRPHRGCNNRLRRKVWKCAPAFRKRVDGREQPHHRHRRSSQLTLSAWVHTTTPGASIMDKSDGGWTWDNSVFYLGGGNGPAAAGRHRQCAMAGGSFQAASSTPSVNDGNWHLVTYVDAAGNYSIYTDGNPVALSSGNSRFHAGSRAGDTVTFGVTTDTFSGDGTVNFKGMLDEIQIYNRALTAAQIQGLYTSDSPNPLLPALCCLQLHGHARSGGTLNVNSISQTIGSLTGPAGAAITLEADNSPCPPPPAAVRWKHQRRGRIIDPQRQRDVDTERRQHLYRRHHGIYRHAGYRATSTPNALHCPMENSVSARPEQCNWLTTPAQHTVRQ